LEVLEPRVNCSGVDLSGIWVGSLTDPQIPSAPLWQETVSLMGSGNSPSGDRFSQDANAPNYSVQWSVTTSLSGDQFQIFDESIDPGNTTDTPPGTGPGWLQITCTLTVSGNSMNGSWSGTFSDTTYSGSVQLTRQSGPAELTSTAASNGSPNAQVGQQLQGYVAEIDASSPLLPSVGLQAEIYNGDGTTSNGRIVAQVPGQVWDIYSTHVYTAPGTYTINAEISDSQGDTATFQGQVTVTAPTPTPTPPSQPNNPPISTPDEVFDFAYRFIRMWEGGLANVKGDLGGLTKFGVTQSTYNTYRRSLDEKPQSVRLITETEVRNIFENRLWIGTGANKLPPLLGIVQLDTEVNFGTGGSNPKKHIKGASAFLQETLSAARPGETDLELAQDYINLRIAFRYERVNYYPSQKKFLQGWLNRDNALQTYVDQLEPAFGQ